MIQIEEEGGLATKHYRIVITIILKQTSSDGALAAAGGGGGVYNGKSQNCVPHYCLSFQTLQFSFEPTSNANRDQLMMCTGPVWSSG